MDKKELITQYAAFSDNQKVTFLGSVAFYLTIAFRDISYTQPDNPENKRKLQGISELQHQLLSQLLSHHRHNEARYPDEIFISILFEKAAVYGPIHSLQQAIMHSLASLSVSSKSGCDD